MGAWRTDYEQKEQEAKQHFSLEARAKVWTDGQQSLLATPRLSHRGDRSQQLHKELHAQDSWAEEEDEPWSCVPRLTGPIVIVAKSLGRLTHKMQAGGRSKVLLARQRYSEKLRRIRCGTKFH